MDELKSLIARLVGTPKDHEADKSNPAKATIQLPEFDITQYAKKLVIAVGVLVPGVLGALKAAGVEITPGIIEVSLGVTAAGLLGVSLASAADILGRVYADRSVRWGAAAPASGAKPSHPDGEAMVWLRGIEGPHLVVDVDRDGDSALFLVLSGSTSQKAVKGGELNVYDASPTWVRQDQVTAFAPGRLLR